MPKQRHTSSFDLIHTQTLLEEHIVVERIKKNLLKPTWMVTSMRFSTKF